MVRTHEQDTCSMGVDRDIMLGGCLHCGITQFANKLNSQVSGYEVKLDTLLKEWRA